MGNNNEIRKRMETYRTVLLAVVWIAGVAGMIGGMVMINDYSLRPFGIALLIVSILGSIIGHFLVNVGLAIPFILLNNGDYLAAIVPEGKHLGINGIPIDKQIEYHSTHRVKLLTDADGLSLRNKPNATANPFTKIANGTEVQYLNTGGFAKLGENKGEWFEIRTKDGIQGWCFSGSLEKI